MRDVPGIRHGLRAAALIFRAREAILRPDFHSHADDVVALLAEQVAGDAGIDAATHAEEDACFFRVHRAPKFGAMALVVNDGAASPAGSRRGCPSA